MRHIKKLLTGVAVAAMVAFVACDNEATTEKDDNIPTTPIQEMCYTPEKTSFELWAPTAESAVVRLYNGDELAEVVAMQRGDKGLWSAEVEGDKKSMYYTFQVSVDGNILKETAGIFARALDVNGNRGAIIDMRDTDPEGWSEDKRPAVDPTEIVIYEMHYRDMTAHESAGSSNPGKYIAMAERGTRSHEGLATGIDHLREMGVTHIHLLPTADFGSIDESRPTNQYNWGYEPRTTTPPRVHTQPTPPTPRRASASLRPLLRLCTMRAYA